MAHIPQVSLTTLRSSISDHLLQAEKGLTEGIIELVKEYLLLGDSQRIYVAIDWGSGALKATVAVVNTSNNTIDSKLASTFQPLKLTEDVNNNQGVISDPIIQAGLQNLEAIIKLTMEVASQCLPFADVSSLIKYSGIATAVFRDRAKNGTAVLQRAQDALSIPFRILSQDEEGILGFKTAVALYPKVRGDHLLAYDSGNGSYQLTTQCGASFPFYPGPLGHGNVKAILKTVIRREAKPPTAHESCNPVQPDEASALAGQIQKQLPPMQSFEWLNKMVKSKDTVVGSIGGFDSIFALTAKAYHTLVSKTNEPWEGCSLTYTQVEQTMKACLGKSDEEYIKADLLIHTTTSTIFLYAVMRYHGIQRVYVREAIGSTLGMLVSPELWK